MAFVKKLRLFILFQDVFQWEAPLKRAALNLLLVLAGMTWTLGAQAIPLSFTKLTGATGGTPAGTAVFRSDLSGLGLVDISYLTIEDNSGGDGGATGQFSGFDLDAIMLSTTLCGDAACAAGLTGLPGFDFSPAGALFTPGTQRPSTDAKLFGTDSGGNNVDNFVATLGMFDGNSTTNIPGADGFISMGDNGILSFNLTAPVSTDGLFLYIGEVGGNGEIAAATMIRGSEQNFPTPVLLTGVPEPGVLLLMGLGLAGVGFTRRRKKPGLEHRSC